MAPPTPAPDDHAELLALIRTWEGEAVEQPPILFKAIVGIGAAMLLAGSLFVLGLVL